MQKSYLEYILYIPCTIKGVCPCLCVFVCYLNKNPNWCAGTKCNRYSMYVKKSKYSYGLEGKAIAFLWHAEILVASRQI